jgi:HK97 family phage prohead protease
MDRFEAPFEVKFVGDSTPGTFEGYGAVFGNIDSHGDVIERGAFASSLAERAQQGRGLPSMLKMHGAMTGNPHEPIGVWEAMSEDSKGLYVKGRLIGLDTEQGKWNYAQLKGGALNGLSIGYKVTDYRPGRGDVKRYIKAVALREVSLVDDPSNSGARVTSIKRVASASRVIEGYATLWGKPHIHPKTGAIEVFAKGCFSRLVGGSPIRLLISHDPGRIVTDTTDGLDLFTDDDGLAFRCDLPPGRLADEAWGMVEADGITGMSVGYSIKSEETVRIHGESVRIINDAVLTEISVVREGAVSQAFAIAGQPEAKILQHRTAFKGLLVDGAYEKMRRALRDVSTRLCGT